MLHVSQEVDGLQDRHLQLASYLHFLRQEIGTTSLLFILPEAGDSWTPRQNFTTSPLATLSGKNNRPRQIIKPFLGKRPRGHILPILRVRMLHVGQNKSR